MEDSILSLIKNIYTDKSIEEKKCCNKLNKKNITIKNMAT